MKKILIALLLLALTMPAALALTKEEATTLAIEAVGEDAEFVRSSLEEGVYDVNLRGTGVTYEVEILDATGAVLEIETVYTGAGRGASFALTEQQALEAAQALLPEGAEGILVLANRDDGACEYEIFYSLAGAVGEVEVNAETGAILNRKTFPEAVTQGVLPLTQIQQLIQGRNGQITEISLDWDHGRYEFGGEATVNGVRYDFEINAATGDFLEWEKD